MYSRNRNSHVILKFSSPSTERSIIIYCDDFTIYFLKSSKPSIENIEMILQSYYGIKIYEDEYYVGYEPATIS
jgi:hypothetical protein